jgi:hypothetical protein
MGSPLYAHLLTRAAEDTEKGGPAAALLAPHDAANPRADALALRLMAAVHRLVLTGQAPGLAAHYPSVGGRAGPEAWDELRAVLVDHAHRIAPLLALPCQTNEVGRCAALAVAFFDVAADEDRPLRLLEVGASAGLNLRFDHYRYAGGGVTWGPPESPVDLSGLWIDPPRRRPRSLTVVERRGCDLRPIDPSSAEGRLGLEASIWADQGERFRRLRGALSVAARLAARVDRASVDEWLAERLAEPVPAGTVTVVYHSIVEEYLEPRVRAAFEATLGEAGARASSDAPLAWARLEPEPGMLRYTVKVTTWPGGRERVLATSGAHGDRVRVQAEP